MCHFWQQHQCPPLPSKVWRVRRGDSETLILTSSSFHYPQSSSNHRLFPSLTAEIPKPVLITQMPTGVWIIGSESVNSILFFLLNARLQKTKKKLISTVFLYSPLMLDTNNYGTVFIGHFTEWDLQHLHIMNNFSHKLTATVVLFHITMLRLDSSGPHLARKGSFNDCWSINQYCRLMLDI